MTGGIRRGPALAVLIVASVVLVGTMVIAGVGFGSGGVPWGPGAPMMGGFAATGQGPVSTIGEAEVAARRVADQWGLRVGEVMQFDNGYYVQLDKPDGSAATELLIDPITGTAQIEWGPAMMWNSESGMRGGSSGPAVVSPDRAIELANDWLSTNRPGDTADDVVSFPGYYTMHTVRDGKIDGMLSVNATTGAVWYHTWHGRFLGEEE
ncbi:MAG: hypothetical protein Q8P61_08325 [Candidatus Nanopelagicales bacterium]|nr:hypothetical protein [Candidatus Nanopelagicales bacterium]